MPDCGDVADLRVEIGRLFHVESQLRGQDLPQQADKPEDHEPAAGPCSDIDSSRSLSCADPGA